ncbi:MAG: NACHT domain-containing protein [Clostridia bacterium]|nr:NACHT domain-containing protein [Clostridia bacterium]
MGEELPIDINKIITNLVEDTAKKVISDGKKVIKTIGGKSEDVMQKFSIDFNLAFKKYLKNAYLKYSRVKTLLYRTEPKYLYDFFECNNLIKDNEIIDSSEIDNILKLSNFIIIKGNGGIGKTTMMKHFFLSELKKKRFIPIFFELKDYNNFDLTLKESLYKSITLLGNEFKEEYFEYALQTGTFLFLLDGYDELSNSKLKKFSYELQELCDKYPDNNFIMSSRPNDNFISFQRFTVLKSMAFSKEKAINLIKKLDYDKETQERFVLQLENGLYNSHKSFASNPLLLTIMLLTYNDYAEIPTKLHIFYAQAFETLYTKHDATKSGYKRELKTNLSKDIFIKIFAKFCFKTYMQEKLEFSKRELDDVFNAIKQNEFEFNNDDFLDDLISAICLMYVDGNVYRFTHRSFQEYFTAQYILELPDNSQRVIYDKLINYRIFDNVLDMLFDMSKERFESNALIPLLENIENDYDGGDRFEFIFKQMFLGINFFENSDMEEGFSYSIRVKNRFLTHISHKYANAIVIPSQESYIEKEEDSKKILEDIIKNERHAGFVENKEIFESDVYTRFTQNCFCNEDVMRISELLSYLKSQHSTIQKELEDLLGV